MAPRKPTRPYRSKHFGNTKYCSISRSSGYFLGDVFLSFIIIIKDKSIWDNIRTAFCKFYPKIFKIFFRMVIFASDNYSGKLYRKKIIFKDKYQKKKIIKLIHTNRKDSLIRIVKISEMIMIKLIGSLTTMPIVKNLQITINLLHMVNKIPRVLLKIIIF
jgi:hypothetical protein